MLASFITMFDANTAPHTQASTSTGNQCQTIRAKLP